MPAETLQTLRAQAMPGEFDNVAVQPRSLREWFRGFVRQRKGRPLTPEYLSELEPLNRLLERDEGFGRIVARPTGHGIPIFTLRYPMALFAYTETRVPYLYVSAPLIALGYLIWQWRWSQR